MVFTMISVSMLTSSPIRAVPSVVPFSVVGITEMPKLVSSRLATVKLIPSIVIEPLRIVWSKSIGEVEKVKSAYEPEFLIDFILAVPSTWPWTMWPPSLSEAVKASSTLTFAAGFNLLKVDFEMVSAPISKLAVWPFNFDMVRQTPFIATLSPILVCLAIAAKLTSSTMLTEVDFADLTWQTACIIPVNIFTSRILRFVWIMLRVTG